MCEALKILKLIKKFGLVGAGGQLRHFLPSRIILGVVRGHGNRQKLSQKACPTEQTVQQVRKKVARIARREREMTLAHRRCVCVASKRDKGREAVRENPHTGGTARRHPKVRAVCLCHASG